MIGPDLQQLAAELNMKVAQGVAYGIVNGYAATFSDGTGNHRVMLTTRFEKPSQKDALMEIIDAQDLKGLYGIKKLMIAKKVVYVVFRCGPEAPSHIRNFLDWLCPLLPSAAEGRRSARLYRNRLERCLRRVACPWRSGRQQRLRCGFRR